jgi:rhodanese-related sulfurtransferase
MPQGSGRVPQGSGSCRTKEIAMKIRMIVSIVLLFALLMSCGNDEQAQAPAAAAPAETEAAVAEVSITDLVTDYFAGIPDNGNYIISETAFIDAVREGQDMTIIDIRRAEDYANGHIAGAVNLPWGTEALVSELPNIPQEGNVYLHCYSGQTAGQAIALMHLAGVPVKSVRYGYNFGISKVEGFEEFVTTEAATLPALGNEIPENVMTAYADFYAGLAEAAGTPFASNIVSEENARAIWEAGDEDVQFVSIRQAADYAENHIEGAVNIPWGPDLPEMFMSMPMDKKLIVYCYSGQTAGQTVGALRALGFDAVSLRGGMGTPLNAPMGWMNQGYPVVSAN